MHVGSYLCELSNFVNSELSVSPRLRSDKAGAVMIICVSMVKLLFIPDVHGQGFFSAAIIMPH